MIYEEILNHLIHLFTEVDKSVQIYQSDLRNLNKTTMVWRLTPILAIAETRNPYVNPDPAQLKI